MIQASSINAIPRPRKTNEIVCYRCGLEYIDSGSRFVSWAPCKDCRAILLTEQGLRANYWKRPRSGVPAPCEVAERRRAS